MLSLKIKTVELGTLPNVRNAEITQAEEVFQRIEGAVRKKGKGSRYNVCSLRAAIIM